MGGWFSEGELASIRGLAELGMQSEVTIKKRVPVTNEADPYNVYGDDAVDHIASLVPEEAVVKGWLFSHPSPVITVVGGKMALINTYRLFVPVGTDVAPGDHAIVGGNKFLVSDTVAESTWLPLLNVSLRRIE